MKKGISLLLCVLMLCGMLSVSAAAEGTLNLKFSNTTAKAGEAVEVLLSAENNPGISAIGAELTFDESVLSLVSATAKAPGTFDFSTITEDHILNWFYYGDNYTGEEIVLLSFKVADNAPAGNYSIGLSFGPWDSVGNKEGQDVDFTVTDGVVTVEADEPAIADGFYLIGVNGWTVDDIAETDKFEVNPENTAEYMLKTSLAVDNEIKVVEVKDGKIVGWYPDGTDNNYKVDEPHSGDVTVYFNPNGNSDWGAFGGYIWINAKEEPKAQIELYGVSTTLGGEIGLNFYLAPTEEQAADTGFKVTLTLGDTTKELALSSAKTRTQGDKTLYQFTFPLRAKQMNQQVEIKAFDGSGQAVALFRPTENKASESFKFSVVDYVKKAIDSASLDDTAKNLVKAMSDYGSLVQVAIPYMANDRADLYNESAINAVSAADLADYKAVVTEGEAAGVSYEGSTLVLDSVTDLRIYLKATEGDLADYSYEIDGKAASLNSKGYVEISNVAAKNLGVFKTLVVKNSEGKTVLTVKLCVLSYVESAIENSDDANLVSAMKALFLYNQAAVAYFKK